MFVRIELETDSATYEIETIGSVVTEHGRKSIEIYFSVTKEYESILREWYMSDVIPQSDYVQCPSLWDYFQTQLPFPIHFV